MTSVFLSGANGYIGAQVAKHLIDQGYTVVGSVRSAPKGDKLKTQLGANFSYEIVTSLSNDDAFDDALKKHPEVSVFLHTASPVILQPEDTESQVVKPAIAGTVSALNAAHKYGKNIKKFVITSSIVAFGDFFSAKYIDESHWNPITYEEAIATPNAGYAGSKKFAEKAAWDFVEKERPAFSLTTIAPVFVFGPVAFLDDGIDSFGSTLKLIVDILKTKEGEELTPYSGPAVDVRDVAKLHIAAFENDNLAGKRLLASNEFWDAQLVVDTAREFFPEITGELVKGTPGSSTEAAKSSVEVNNKTTRELTGHEWIPIKTTFKDSIAQISEVWKA